MADEIIRLRGLGELKSQLAHHLKTHKMGTGSGKRKQQGSLSCFTEVSEKGVLCSSHDLGEGPNAEGSLHRTVKLLVERT